VVLRSPFADRLKFGPEKASKLADRGNMPLHHLSLLLRKSFGTQQNIVRNFNLAQVVKFRADLASREVEGTASAMSRTRAISIQ